MGVFGMTVGLALTVLSLATVLIGSFAWFLEPGHH